MSDYALATTLGYEVDEDEMLLRLVWDPEDINPETGELMTSAFASDDLKNHRRGLSVDQKSIAVREVMDFVAGNQQQNAKGKKRDTSMLTEVKTSRVSSLKLDGDDQRVLAVIQIPIPAANGCPENPAHVEILNVSTKKSKATINEIRAKLQVIFSLPKRFEALAPAPQQQRDFFDI